MCPDGFRERFSPFHQGSVSLTCPEGKYHAQEKRGANQKGCSEILEEVSFSRLPPQRNILDLE
jgi:hypothetical protein